MFKMGALPQYKADSALMRQDMRKYGQESSGNVLEREVYSPGDF